MANQDLLRTLQEYAEDEGKPLPPKMFQRLIIQSVTQILTDNAAIKEWRKEVQDRHSAEDKLAEKKDARRWEIKVLALANIIALLLAVLGLK